MDNKKPTLSIITVVYNGARFIEATIQSILGQDCKDFEYIIIDGGSTDGTLDLIHKYESQITKWISESDKGLYDAMNKGIHEASGEFLWFINAGDEIFDSTTVGKILRQGKEKADIFYGEALIIDENRNEIGMRRQKTPENLTWQSLKIGMVVSHQSFIVRKDKAPIYNLKYQCSADIEWVIQSLKASVNIVNTHLILSRFMDGGRSKSTIRKNLTERFRIMIDHYGLLPTLINHIKIAVNFFYFVLRNRRF